MPGRNFAGERVYVLSSDMNGLSLRFLRSSLCMLGVLALCCRLGAQQSSPVVPPAQTPTAEAGQGVPASQPPAAPASRTSPVAAETSALPPTTDPGEIVRRSVLTDHHTLEMARHYTFRNRQVIKHLGKHGEVKSTEIKTFDVNFYYGQRYARLIQIDDKPLSEQEQKKEDEKLEKFLAKFRNESESDREKRLEKERKQREQRRAFLQDVTNAYDFRVLGEEKVDGADSYVIQATPRPGFQPTQAQADMLKKIRGKLWIEKKDYNWVKVEAEATDTISFGLFLFRIHPGSHFVLERTLVNSEVWLLKRLDISGGARIALLKNENVEQEEVDSDFKKFVTSVRIVPGVKEVQPETSPK